MNLEGEPTVLRLSPAAFDVPSYSPPDGSKIAYGDGSDIRVYTFSGGADVPLTTGGAIYPVWPSSGEDVYFSVGGDPSRRPADASEVAEQLDHRPGDIFVQDLSPDDSIILVRETTAHRARDVLLMRLGPNGAVFEEFLTGEWNEGNPVTSPDGQWVAYQSDESSEARIYVHSFPEKTSQHVVSPGLGTEPLWSPDGRTIYYRSGSLILAVDVIRTQPTFDVSAPYTLFDGPGYSIAPGAVGWVHNWDIHPDGDRFLMIRPVASEAEAGGAEQLYGLGLLLVTNWFVELRQRMGN